MRAALALLLVPRAFGIAFHARLSRAHSCILCPSSSHSHQYTDWLPYLQGFEYSRSGNPNRNALERTLASLEAGGAYALAFASGSATTATVLQSLGPNAHLVSVNDVYGGTFRYMTRVAGENQGLETTFVDLENADEDEVNAALRENTKVHTPRKTCM